MKVIYKIFSYDMMRVNYSLFASFIWFHTPSIRHSQGKAVVRAWAA